MRLQKGRTYWIRFFDHNEAEKKDRSPKYILNVVGKYAGTKGAYLVFVNWWGEDGDDENIISKANIVKKAIIDVKELR